MAECKEYEIVESLDNAWRALNKQYSQNPIEEVRIATNLLAKIIGKVNQDYISKKKKEKPGQITIEEWLEWLNS